MKKNVRNVVKQKIFNEIRNQYLILNKVKRAVKKLLKNDRKIGFKKKREKYQFKKKYCIKI